MISFVIVSYRSKEVLSECMTALASQVQKGDEVIVVENGQDKSLSEMGVFGREDFHLVFNEENVGYSKGCNQGLTLASNDWVVLLNPDTQPLIDSLPKLKLGLAKAQEGDMFSLELVNPDGTRQDYYRRFPSVRALLVMFFVPTKHQEFFPAYRKYVYQGELESRNTFEQPPGAGLVVHGNSRLDEDFFLYGSDLMLCWEFVHSSEREIPMLPVGFIHHRGQGGTSNSPELADWLRAESARGFALFFAKSGQKTRRWLWVICFACLEVIGILKHFYVPPQRTRRIQRLRTFLQSL